MTGTGRRPSHAIFTVVAVCAIILAGSLLPTFGSAAPASEVVTELAELRGESAEQSAARPSGDGTGNATPDDAGVMATSGASAGTDRNTRGAGTQISLPIGDVTITVPQGGALVSLPKNKVGGTQGGPAGGVGAPPGASGLIGQLAAIFGGAGGPTVSGTMSLGGAGAGAGTSAGVGTGTGAGAGGDGVSVGMNGNTSVSGGGGGGITGFSSWFNTANGSSGTVSSGTTPEQCRAIGEQYLVCFQEELLPGTNTTVTVYTPDGPAGNVRVYFNGNYMGATDADGEVTGLVPYVRELQVRVETDGGTPPANVQGYFSVASPDGGVVNTSVTADLNVSVHGDVIPGGDAVVRVTIEGTPVSDAVVTVDGERVGRTDSQGRLSVQLPVAEETTVGATRGELSKQTQVQLAALELSIRGAFPLGIALPGQPATVVLTDDGEPVEGASVTVAGTDRGQTGPNGGASVTLPMSPTIRVTAETSIGLVVQTHKQVWFVPTLVGLLLGSLLGGLAITYRQSTASGRGLLEQARLLLGELAGRSLSALVSVVAGVESASARMRERIHAWLVRLRTLRRSSNGLRLHSTWIILQAALHARRDRLVASGRALLARLVSLWENVSGDQNTSPSPSTATASATTRSARERVERAWRRLLETLSALGRTRTMTPGDVAERAIAAGLPPEPVERLTDAFRAVEYSSEDPEPYAAAAENAAAAVTEPAEQKEEQHV